MLQCPGLVPEQIKVQLVQLLQLLQLVRLQLVHQAVHQLAAGAAGLGVGVRQQLRVLGQPGVRQQPRHVGGERLHVQHVVRSATGRELICRVEVSIIHNNWKMP